METSLKSCACGRQFTQADSTGPSCFKCKLSTVGFGFRGVAGVGRSAFQEHTVRSYLDESDRKVVASGGNPTDFEPVTNWM